MSRADHQARRILAITAAALLLACGVLGAILAAYFPLPQPQRAWLALAFPLAALPLCAVYLLALARELGGIREADARRREAALRPADRAAMLERLAALPRGIGVQPAIAWALLSVVIAGALAAWGGIAPDVAAAALLCSVSCGTVALIFSGYAAQLLLRPVANELAGPEPPAPRAPRPFAHKVMAAGAASLLLTIGAVGAVGFAVHREGLLESRAASVDRLMASVSTVEPTRLAWTLGRVAGGRAAVFDGTGTRRLDGGTDRVDLPAAEGTSPRGHGLVVRRSVGDRVLVAEIPAPAARDFVVPMLPLVLLLLAAGGLVIRVCTRALTQPVGELTRTAELLARGDLGATVPAPTDDELGELTSAAAVMALALRDLVADVRGAMGEVRSSAAGVVDVGGRVRDAAALQRSGVGHATNAMQQASASVRAVDREVRVLASFAASASTATTEMTASLEELERVAGELDRAVSEASHDVEGIARATETTRAGLEELDRAARTTSDGLSTSTHRVARMERDAAAGEELAGAAARDAAAGLALAAEAEAGITALRATVHEAHRRVGALGKRGTDISAIVEFIADVANRTNLLALNASIIAAQAGDSGRAFAVVAEEIRDLASQIASSTSSIGNIVQGVQEEVAATSERIVSGDALAERGLLLARGVREALEQIERSAVQASQHAAAIGEAVGAQAGATRHVRDLAGRVDELARGFGGGVQALADAGLRLRALGGQVASLTSRVGAALAEQASAGRQQLLALGELEKVLERLGRAVEEHGTGTGHVLEELTRLSSAASANQAIVEELSGHAERLEGHARSLQDRIGRFRV